jgi:dipeptidyl aminopeptidase/acylaminoacyl peptidase
MASSPGPVGRLLFDRLGLATFTLDPRIGPGYGEILALGVDAAWSPRGDAIVFAAGGLGSYDLYLSRGDGENTRQLTDTSSNERDPTWSPDGRQIAFSSDRDGDWDIYVMNVNGTDVRNITTSLSTADDHSPKWSPDGTLIAFQTLRAGNWEVFTIHPDGSDPRNVTNSPYSDGPTDWSPDSSTILFETKRGSWDVYAVGVDGSNPHPLIDHESSDGGGIYSPDGSKVAFISNRSGHFEIYVAASDGSGTTQFSTGGEDVHLTSWQTIFDQEVPTVRAQPLAVKSNAPLAGRFSTSDNSDSVSWALRFPTLLHFEQFIPVGDFAIPVGPATTRSIPLTAATLRKRGIRVPAKLKYCIQVTDASDNRSRESCSTLTIKNAKAKPKPKPQPKSARPKQGGK